MKKMFKFLALTSLLSSLFGLTAISKQEVKAEAAITSGDVRIAVVRPDWWESAGAWQVMRVANTEDDINNNAVANITYYEIESYTDDTYYTSIGSDRFSEYSTSGVVFYDIPYSAINGKYFDLARLSTTDPSEATVWNSTGAEVFTPSLLHKIWRIWGNGAGIYRPEGENSESRQVANRVINSLLYGYLSCDPSSINGYGAFNTLNTNFNLTGRTFSSSDTVLDFVSAADYATGRGAGVTVLTSTKIAMMQANAVANNGNVNYISPSTRRNVGLVVVISSISLTSLIGYYLLRTKKQ